jgi:hypothetical protein
MSALLGQYLSALREVYAPELKPPL